MDMKGHVIVEYRNPDTGEVIERSEGDNHVFVDQFKLNARPFSKGGSTSDPHFILMATDGTKELDTSIPVLPGVICGGGTEYTPSASQPTAQAGYSSADSSYYWDVSNEGGVITLKKTLVFDFLPNSPSNTTIRYVGLGLSPMTPWGYYRGHDSIGNTYNVSSQYPSVSSQMIAMMYDIDTGYAVYPNSNCSYSNMQIQVVTLSTGATKVVTMSDILPDTAKDYPIFKADSDESYTNGHNYQLYLTAAVSNDNVFIYKVATKYYTHERQTVYLHKIIKYTCDTDLTHCDSGVEDGDEFEGLNITLSSLYILHNNYFYRTGTNEHRSIYRASSIKNMFQKEVEEPTLGFPNNTPPTSNISPIMGLYENYLIAHGDNTNIYGVGYNYHLASWVFNLSDFSIYSVFPDYIATLYYSSYTNGAYIVSVNKGVKGWLSQPYLPFNNLVTAYKIPNAEARPKDASMRIIYQITCTIR